MDLEVLKLDLGRWGCENYSSLKIYSDTTIGYIAEMITKMANLKELELSLRSWGYENIYITYASVQNIFKSLSNCTRLEKINLDFTKWGYLNPNINDLSIENLQECFSKLINLQSIEINMNLWKYFKNFKTIYDTFITLPRLYKCVIHTEKEEPYIVSL